jgi:FAD/FMN-containing dehydrogenase
MHAAYDSWGRFPHANQEALPIFWRDESYKIDASAAHTYLPRGLGRSYGDVCLNDGGVLLLTENLKRFLAFDESSGLLRCESGVTLADILKFFVPRGWFPPVTPGTKFVTVGGAIANDVHGKNHHSAGTFGRHVKRLELLRSCGERLVCSPCQNGELFRATVGGLGLTGLILWAELALKPIDQCFLEVEHIRFPDLETFFHLSEESEHGYEYSVAWVDCLATGKNLGRGIFMRGNHVSGPASPPGPGFAEPRFSVPFDFPTWVLNPWTIGAFNSLYYHRMHRDRQIAISHYDPFFYPLDAVRSWNRMYGSHGFVQHQCVVPTDSRFSPIRDILRIISRAKVGSFLAILKVFGDLPSPGMLSFPRPGVTLALDFANRPENLRLLDEIDNVVADAGGAVNPSKDARMAPAHFRRFFPSWQDVLPYRDPHFSSSFWRRVTRPTSNDA